MMNAANTGCAVHPRQTQVTSGPPKVVFHSQIICTASCHAASHCVRVHYVYHLLCLFLHKGIVGPTLPPPSSSAHAPTHESSAPDHSSHSHEYDSSVGPSASGTDDDENGKENGIHPLYPTKDERPNKGIASGAQKPMKKPTKTDSKYPGVPYGIKPTASNENPKYDFNNYDIVDEDDEAEADHVHGSKKGHNHAGPGFFNPTITKHQYGDYDESVYTNGGNFHRPTSQQKPHKPSYNPYIIQHPNGQQELLSILGSNGQNLPPNLSIEHILQHIQGNGGANVAPGDIESHPAYGIQQAPNGLNFPFGQTPQIHPNAPNDGNQKIPGRPAPGKVQKQSTTLFFVTSTAFINFIDFDCTSVMST